MGEGGKREREREFIAEEEGKEKWHMCVADGMRMGPTSPKRLPVLEEPGGETRSPLVRMDTMLAMEVPCHSRRWFPMSSSFSLSDSPGRDTLYTAFTLHP